MTGRCRGFLCAVGILALVLTVGVAVTGEAQASHGGSSGQQCIRDAADFDQGNICTANDVRIASFEVLDGPDSCLEGEEITVTVKAEILGGAKDRFDIGLYIDEGGGNAEDRGNICYRDYLHPVSFLNTDLDLVGGFGPFFNAELDFCIDPPPDTTPGDEDQNADNCDECGDLRQDNTAFFTFTATVLCTDSDDPDLFADVGSCVSWNVNDNQTTADCWSEDDTVPDESSKCRCEAINIGQIDFELQANINVCKETLPPGDIGNFDLQIDGDTELADANDGECTGPILVGAGTFLNPGENHYVGEVAGATTDLGDYVSSIVCRDAGNNIVASCNNCTVSDNFVTLEDDVITCTITNQCIDTDGDQVCDGSEVCPGADDTQIDLPCGTDEGECSAGTNVCECDAFGENCNLVCEGETGPSEEICDGLDNDCDGLIDEDLTQDTTCGVGACASTGIETCVAGEWVNDTCTPGTGTAETCNNIDDDCDGDVDEDLTQGTTCGVGACASTGIETCVAGDWVNDTCTPGTGTAETCNNIDDDCDGDVDEDLTQGTTCGVGACASTGIETCVAGDWVNDTCTPGTGTAETCNNIDDDCDGDVDEDLTQGTTCGVGACASTGIETCVAGDWVNDTCTPGTGTAETCNNIDDDCDGDVDEDLTQGTTCGVGACASTGIETCVAGDWVNDTCTPGTGTAETCNNIDDDCDGDVDEDLTQGTTCGVGACASTGIETCVAGDWVNDTCTPGTGTAETCNNIDDDCDGDVDEDLTQDTTCGVGACASTGIETCVAGDWVNDTCTPGTGTAETCNNIDDDCDGDVDEDLTQGTTCGVGACASTGIETCVAGDWVNDTCTPGTGTAETCNNIDDDCDGDVDEDLTQGTTCGVGACASTGIETCVAGDWVNDTCTPGTGTAETCNNIDDDCDGDVDEDLTQGTTCGVGACASTGIETCVAGDWVNDTCTPGTGTAETCNNIDDDCDGDVDEDLTQGTTCGVGACASTGIETCVAGDWVNDTCTPGTGTAETCNNIDDDCDGDVDEDLTQGTTCGVGACASTGIETCVAGDWVNDTCTPGTGTAETCNNIDDDCDGDVDEDLVQGTTCGLGECFSTGFETCVAGNWVGDTCVPGIPGEEVCPPDGLDNDCDGVPDDGLVCDCLPKTQGYWHRQCLGVPEVDGPDEDAIADGIDPGRGRGPTGMQEGDAFYNLATSMPGPQMVCFEEQYADFLSSGLLSFEGTSNDTTCVAMNAEPASDPCERAIKQLTALILNVCSDKVTGTCEVDVSADGCVSTTVDDLIVELDGLIVAGIGGNENLCRQAATCASEVNEGTAIVDGGGSIDTDNTVDPRSIERLRQPRQGTTARPSGRR